ncbi:UDP-N-acetylmuramate:L-alanyl-gamma-D-glutamyl-meso-diaminopimelate ligase [Aliidiomarina sedimenti]|uniref:UDP-N-acetylmuramate--L-alanyl-gamma-D-glutamyl-meso-2,6-diaminoheptandioate ligase n=1 Tax=Aliidiomarina sedimenti TaxID=1933879 RepID=A0ABY0BV30_9GAMM|nr:UDP-N-acetylmuramate:L-alanyl-gamma-D-glutamyl-meso-diaminopimelate ligase [Aliidiomarina sedimenti]RUO27937.1 UDP-N-acetylmuramate:L-alanyl-gamma-D-glutamyl-meso-diaminopimelate ligase [Aliidiomarina sedimenti]
MHIHILGICGTFMGGIAAIARQLGHRVTGSDAHVYPPMSTMLEQMGIVIGSLDDVGQLDPAPDLVIIGNALSRGNPQVETILNQNIAYTSGPQWLGENVLREKWVLAVAGTHGKTTTTSMLTHILEEAGMQPGFLIGGVVERFQASARLTDSIFFVIEADEYDTAFFDKRSKFVHYHPNTLALNNLEFDHADIFPDLAAIQRQFHHVVRTVPGKGQVISPQDSASLNEVLAQGCWSEQQYLNAPDGWQIRDLVGDGSEFEVSLAGQAVGQVHWHLLGEHNLQNALMAIAAARHAGVEPAQAIASLASFTSPKRRLERIYQDHRVTVFDDFAHHPTAIATTLQGMRAHSQAQHSESRLIAVVEPRSNTMRAGVHKHELAQALSLADEVFMYDNGQLQWSTEELAANTGAKWQIERDIGVLVTQLCQQRTGHVHIVLMSNGSFGGLREALLKELKHD